MAHGENAANKANWCGRDYWKPRKYNTGCTGYRGSPHADRNSIKRFTRRAERRIAKNRLKNPVISEDYAPLKQAM